MERQRREAAAETGAHAARVDALEEQWGAVQVGFQGLEGRMTAVTQAATRVGNRLVNAEAYRQRALEGAAQITSLQEFAHARDPSHLSPLFHDSARLAEAAVGAPALLPPPDLF